MKTKSILILWLIFMAISAQTQTKVVELPNVTFANSRTLEISKVTLSDTETVLDVGAFFTPGWWIRVVSDTYLLADGKKYMIRSSNGIELDSLFWMPKSGEASFKLIFEPLPKNTQSFDFIESDCESCFKIYGIDLANTKTKLPKIPSEFLQIAPVEPNFQVQLQKGNAKVRGMLYKYVPTQEEYTLVYLNPLTGVENSSAVKISNDGSFTADITVYSPTLIVLTDKKILNIPIWVAPNQESRMWVNLPEIYRSGSKLLRNKQSNGKQVYYSGYLSELSADLSRDDISKPAKEDHSSKIIDMNQKQYIDFTLAKYNETIEYNNNLKISPLAKKIANYEQVLRLTSILNNVDYTVANAYSKKHNVSIREALKVIMLEKNEDDNDFYKLMPFDDPDILLVSYISQYIQILGYSQPNSSDPYATIRHLAENNEVLPEERELIKQYILSMENNQIIENHSEMIEVLNKYRSLSEKHMNNQRGANYLAKFWDKDQAFLLDLIKTQKICKSIQEYNPISDSEKPEILKLHPVLSELIYEQNEEILARIEENKNKSGFEIIDPPANVDEELFSELIKPFKGKVILVDLWGTWCAPCRMAHVEMDPMKASFEGKDVVFLYIAGENSPKNTWENMISGIQGSHYRLKETQWNFLNDMLKVSGVPTYIILDKEGKQTFYHTGFPGVDIIKRELNKLL